MKKIIFFLILTTVIVSPILADIPRPKETPKPAPSKELDSRMRIDLRSDVKVPTLKIRRDALKQLRAAIDQADDSQNVAAVASFGNGALQTIVGGVLLSVGLIFAGVLAFRGNGRFTKVAVPLLVVICAGCGAFAVLANSPPPSSVSLTTRIFGNSVKTYGYASGDIKIQVVDRWKDEFSASDHTDVVLEIPNGGEGTNSE